MNRLLILSVLVIPLLAAGCFGGGSSAHAQSSATKTTESIGGLTTFKDHLWFAVALKPRCAAGQTQQACSARVPLVRHYWLSCDPNPAGTFPNPQAGCRALANYQIAKNHPGSCIGIDDSSYTSTATINGTYAKKPFHLHLDSGSSWCGQRTALLHDYWVLSAFPCSTVVAHASTSVTGRPTNSPCASLRSG